MESYCIRHPDRPAELACARCGDFICSGCVVSGDLCTVCKSRLFREGVPYSGEEKARATARSCRRLAERATQLLFASGGVAVLLRMSVLSGLIPSALGSLAVVAAVLSVLFGLAAAVLALVGMRASRRGQPGPALPGVFPPAYALTVIALGVLPLALALVALREFMAR